MQASFRRTRDELQRSKRDLALVKQQATQQRLAGDRQLERLRSRYTEEGIKTLRTRVPKVYVAEAKSSKTSTISHGDSQQHVVDSLIQDLETKKRQLTQANLALKKFSLCALNTATDAARCMCSTNTARMQDVRSSSSSRSEEERKEDIPSNFTEHDLFPVTTQFSMDFDDNSEHPAAVALQKVRSAIQTYSERLQQSTMRATLQQKQEERRRCREQTDDRVTNASASPNAIEIQDHVQELLSRTRSRVEELETLVEKQSSQLSSYERRLNSQYPIHDTHAMGESIMEPYRQRYLSLLTRIEKQEARVAEEREKAMLFHIEAQPEETILPKSTDTKENQCVLTGNGTKQGTPLDEHKARQLLNTIAGEDKENSRLSAPGVTVGERKRSSHGIDDDEHPRSTKAPRTAGDSETMRFVTVRKRKAR